MKFAPMVFALVLLAGCSSQAPAPQVTPAPSEAPAETGTPAAIDTSTPTSTPTPTPTAEAAASVITTAGYGDLKLGKPVPATTELVAWDPEYCTRVAGYPEGDPGAGHWISDPDTAFVVRTSNAGKDTKIDTMTVFSPDIETKSGAHTGMTIADLKKLFPDVKPVRASVSDTYTVKDNLGQVVFEVAPDDLPEYWGDSAEVGTVLFIHIQSNDFEPFAIAGSDGGGNCSG